MGAEYINQPTIIDWCAQCTGAIEANGGPIPANIQAAVPGLERCVYVESRRAVADHGARQAGGLQHGLPLRGAAAPGGRLAAGRLEVVEALTLNLGVRYDVQIGVHSENVELQPWLTGDLPHDLNNIAPRLGFAYSLDDRTVVRGGFGLFYTQVSTDEAHQTALYTVSAVAEQLNDGRAGLRGQPVQRSGARPSSRCWRRRATSRASAPAACGAS